MLASQLLFVAKVNASDAKIKSPETNKITILSDFIPPYVYQDEQGNIVGKDVDKLKKIFKLANIDYKLEYRPWNRALSEVKNQSNVLMYPISRTPDREKEFQWIIPLHSLNYRLYGLKGSFDPTNVDLKSGKYTLTCQDTTILCKILEVFGVPERSIIRSSSLEIKQVARMFRSGRINFLIVDKDGLSSYIPELGIEASEMIAVENYNYPVMEYLAGNTQVSKSVIKKLNLAALQLQDSTK